jgi:hypothetical protein
METEEANECVAAIQEALKKRGVEGKKTSLAAVTQLERAQHILDVVSEGQPAAARVAWSFIISSGGHGTATGADHAARTHGMVCVVWCGLLCRSSSRRGSR